MNNIGRYETRDNSLRQKCLRANVNYSLVQMHRARHKDLTDEEVIEIYIRKAQEENVTLADKFRELGVDPNTGYAYIQNHPELTREQVLEYYSKPKEISLEKKLKEAQVGKRVYNRIKKENTELSVDEIIIKCQEYLKEQENSLTNLCKKHGLSIKNTYAHKYRHPELTDEQVIEECLKMRDIKGGKTTKQLLEENNINKSKYERERKKHPELTREQIIELCKQTTRKERLVCEAEVSFKEMCRKYGVEYTKAAEYRRKHLELTDEQVIVYYRPDLYINIFGELIEI